MNEDDALNQEDETSDEHREHAEFVADRMLILDGAANFMKRHNMPLAPDDVIMFAVFLSGEAIPTERGGTTFLVPVADDDGDEE